MEWVVLVVGVATLLVTSVAALFAWRSWRLQKRSEKRALDRNDVDWDWEWTALGRMRFFNDGRDPAHEVGLAVTVDGETRNAEAERVDPDDVGFDLDFPQFRDTLRDEAAQQLAETPLYQLTTAMPQMHFVGYRVSWRSPSGAWHVDTGSSPTSLQDHE